MICMNGVHNKHIHEEKDLDYNKKISLRRNLSHFKSLTKSW